jgi:bisphosphoglycerate-dependent phosphoglycerate mutase
MKNSLRATKMSEPVNQVLQIVYLASHGETAWTLSGQHTGLTDLPLTERGERNARRLQERLRGLSFAKVFTSPLQRAKARRLVGSSTNGRHGRNRPDPL